MMTVVETTEVSSSKTNSLEVTSFAYSDQLWSTAYVNYFKDADRVPPDSLNSSLSEHEIRVSRRSDSSPNVCPTQVRIRNIRGEESKYSFADHGFKISLLPTLMRNWQDIEERKQVYFKEVAELLKKETGAKHVFSYEHHVRTDSLENALRQDSNGDVDINGPVRRVHIDESPASARNEFRYWVLEKSGNEHLHGRDFGIYNVWKPLRKVYKDPLCLCDVRTVADEDLQSGKVTVPGPGEIENFAIRPPKVDGKHKFVYLREQETDEALIFRIFDSRVDPGGFDGLAKIGDSKKRSNGVAHTSFVDPGTEGMEPRQSVEVRSFCVF